MNPKNKSPARKEILEAALKIFSADPTESVALAATISGHVKSMIYHYFNDKKHLVRETYRYWLERATSTGGMDLSAWVLMRADDQLTLDVRLSRAVQLDALIKEFGDERAARLVMATKDGIGMLRVIGEEIDENAVLELLKELINARQKKEEAAS